VAYGLPGIARESPAGIDASTAGGEAIRPPAESGRRQGMVITMESRAKVLGHPVHPMLIVLPLGLFIASVVFDVLHQVTRRGAFAVVAFWNIAAGIVGGLVAAVFGLWDWLAIPGGTRAKTVGAWHGGGNAVVLVLFGVSWLLRAGSPGNVPQAMALLLSFVGLAAGGVTGWLGGELVDRLGVGVDKGAHLDSPSSLSGLPASGRSDGPAAAHVDQPASVRS
jgi:uncharacterized membrane protein